MEADLNHTEENSLSEIAYSLIKEQGSAVSLNELIDKICAIRNLGEVSVDFKNQLYFDLISSGRFVYVGDGLFDLKDNNLEYWEKDGTFFANESNDEDIEINEDEDDIEFSDFNLDEFVASEPDIEEDEDEEDEKPAMQASANPLPELDDEDDGDALVEEDIEDYLETGSDEDDDKYVDPDLDLDETDQDEDEYNKYMDDYENLYE